jgi:hypothetical protein
MADTRSQVGGGEKGRGLDRGRRGAQEAVDLRPIRRVLIISFVLAVLIQVSGINTIIDYAPLVLKSAG